jgi:hypothetical protein
MSDERDVHGERWARSSPLPRIEGGAEPWPAWKVFSAILLYFWGVMHAAVDVRAVVEWLSK